MKETPPKLISEKFIDDEKIVQISKYFYGQYYTINKFSINECSKVFGDAVFCYYTTGNDDYDDFDLLAVKYSSSRVYESGGVLKKEQFFSRNCAFKENIFK